ncbi:FixH family protein [Halobacillus sp. Marseille-Q1614]|uniref:FixH family protein n=1 Tax=Halobacillus sp. Marseille-Q1614 TaxID=2709134 RepID=UPI00156FCF72|nr:FixH family protein [Halobacillus sp. Marseille-Q1614]
MRKLTLLMALIILSAILAACGSSKEEEKNTVAEEELFNPEVEVKFEEEPLPLSEDTAIQAVVTSNNTPVEDADYVEFEIWNDAKGQDSSETIETEHKGEGVYEAVYTFEEAGTYQVIAHTQARNIHTMPQVEVQAGEKSEASDTHDDSHSHDEETDGHHDHGGGKYSVTLNSNEFTSGKKSELLTHIEKQGENFEGAEVSFEISSEQLNKHEFIAAQEQENGEYSAQYKFPSAGEYLINVHYVKQDEDIHGHKEINVQVN